ncbi:helix-turn-helix domain-containing protein [Cylindrospermopsis raciborskii]|uniref:helix-turn-helix domain-containing protein n=1 Tax=Cylindrospermopsis raciborskii TaxID=77022 RepID=UPI002155995A|nr:helix-turn-helix domain-containing protein [Cylindrospermopsis raciborskii]
MSNYMPKPYSIDLRNRVIVAWVAQEGSQRQLAERFKVSLSFVRNLVRRYRETGQVEPKQCGGYEKPIIAGQYLNMIKSWLDEKNDLLLSELCDRLRETTDAERMRLSYETQQTNGIYINAIALHYLVTFIIYY